MMQTYTLLSGFKLQHMESPWRRYLVSTRLSVISCVENLWFPHCLRTSSLSFLCFDLLNCGKFIFCCFVNFINDLQLVRRFYLILL